MNTAATTDKQQSKADCPKREGENLQPVLPESWRGIAFVQGNTPLWFCGAGATGQATGMTSQAYAGDGTLLEIIGALEKALQQARFDAGLLPPQLTESTLLIRATRSVVQGVQAELQSRGGFYVVYAAMPAETARALTLELERVVGSALVWALRNFATAQQESLSACWQKGIPGHES